MKELAEWNSGLSEELLYCRWLCSGVQVSARCAPSLFVHRLGPASKAADSATLFFLRRERSSPSSSLHVPCGRIVARCCACCCSCWCCSCSVAKFSARCAPSLSACMVCSVERFAIIACQIAQVLTWDSVNHGQGCHFVITVLSVPRSLSSSTCSGLQRCWRAHRHKLSKTCS